MANILSLVWYKVLPAKFGGQKGIALFNQHIGEHHQVYCLCAANNEPTGQESYKVIRDLPVSKWQFLDPLLHQKISTYITKYEITHLLIEHCYHGLNGIWLAQKHGLKIVVHSHNIEYERFRTMHKWWWPILKQLERKAHRAANLSLFKTRADMDHAVKTFHLEAGSCMVVPVGIERSAPIGSDEKKKARVTLEKTHGIDPATRIIYFNGTLDYEPNALALTEIVEKIIPKLAAQTDQSFVVLVTGRLIFSSYGYLKKLSHPCYINAGLVDDVETYFAGSDIFINPVSTGGGIKVKLMEALSYGLPVLSYVSGAAGVEPDLAGQALTIIPDGDTAKFASAIMEHWKDEPPVPDEFFQEYSWESISKQVAERIGQL